VQTRTSSVVELMSVEHMNAAMHAALSAPHLTSGTVDAEPSTRASTGDTESK
jgi:hypothetical protein